MLKHYRKIGTILFVIVSILLVAYAFVAYLPHGHECLEANCAVCNLIDVYRGILFGVTLLVAVSLLSNHIFILFVMRLHIASFSDSTPVGLKVKLSN